MFKAVLGFLVLFLSLDFAMAASRCRSPLSQVKVQAIRVGDFVHEARSRFKRAKVPAEYIGEVEVYFQELKVVQQDGKTEKRSRLFAIGSALSQVRGESIHPALIYDLARGTQELGMAILTRRSDGALVLSPAENNAILNTLRNPRDVNDKKTTQARVSSLMVEIRDNFPSFELMPLWYLGVLNVSAPNATSLAEKVRFVLAIQNSEFVNAVSKLGFVVSDVVLNGKITAQPAERLGTGDIIQQRR